MMSYTRNKRFNKRLSVVSCMSLLSLILVSCSHSHNTQDDITNTTQPSAYETTIHKNSTTETNILDSITPQYRSQFATDDVKVTGDFQWSFHLGPAKQLSTHTFTNDYIDYVMTGKVYSTDYRMHKLSYDDTTKKWIGQTDDGTVYTLFFKDMHDNSMTIYKHKCKEGLDEALALQRPADDETKDHGWNVYTRVGVQTHADTLAFSGIFYNETQSIEIQDAKAVYNNKTYQKLTHHTGEKRWVGQLDDHYLVVFYRDAENNDTDNNTKEFAIVTFDDVEQAYKAKHDKQAYQVFSIK